MNKFIISVIVFIALLAGVTYLAPMLVPASVYKARIETAATDALGRKVTIGDNMSFRLFPQAAFHVENLTIANEAGFTAPHLAAIEEANIGVKILPLISKKVEISRFVLIRPTINLEQTKSGRVNWNLASADAPQSQTTAPSGEIPLRELSLGDVRIVDGSASFKDAASKGFTASAINLKARLSNLNAPFTLKGDMVFQGAPTQADLIITTPAGILRQKGANIKADLKIDQAALGADLTLEEGAELAYQGDVAIDAPDLPALAALMNMPLEDAPGFDNLLFKGAVNGNGSNAKIALKEFAFDATKAEGDLNIDWSGAKPYATGNLATDLLDLRPYMPPPVDAAAGFPAWSEDSIDFTSLRNIDATLNIAAAKVFLNDLKIDDARMKVTITNGRMVADMPSIGMYGGQGSGQLVVNARSKTPSLSGVFTLSSLNAQPFAIDMLKTDKLLGLGGFEVTFSAQGNSQQAIMNSLNGKGGFDFNDGAIKGFNIAKIISAAASLEGNLKPGNIANAIATAQSPHEATDFSKFLSNFSMKNGVVSASAIELAAPYFTMNGGGAVNLPNQTLNLKLAPRGTTALTETSAQEGQKVRTVTVPLIVTGTFSAPKLGLDVEALAKDRLQGGVRELISGALGDKKDGTKEAGAENEPKETSPEEALANEALKALFGSRKNSGE